MKRLLMIGLVFLAVCSYGAQTTVEIDKGAHLGTKGRSIGANPGSSGAWQLLISSDAGKWAIVDYEIKADPNNSDTVFISSASVGISTTVALARVDLDGCSIVGYPLFAGESISIEGKNWAAVYGWSPYSSATVYMIELRKTPVGKNNPR